MAGAVGRAVPTSPVANWSRLVVPDGQRPGGDEAGHDRGVRRRRPGGEGRAAGGRGQPGDVDVALDRERDAPQRPPLGALVGQPPGGGPQHVRGHVVDPGRGLPAAPACRTRPRRRPRASTSRRRARPAARRATRERRRRRPSRSCRLDPDERLAGGDELAGPAADPGDAARPGRPAPTTSIFMASSTATRSPAATVSPSATDTSPTLAANGATTSAAPAGAAAAAPPGPPGPPPTSAPPPARTARSSSPLPPSGPAPRRTRPAAGRRKAAMSSASSASQDRRCAATSKTVSSTRTSPRPATMSARRSRSSSAPTGWKRIWSKNRSSHGRSGVVWRNGRWRLHTGTVRPTNW